VKDYEPVLSFGEDAARRHDDVKRGDEVEAVEFLEHMAQGGPALELAIGTGRIALPLAWCRWYRRLNCDGFPTTRQAGRRWHIGHTYEQAAEWSIARPLID